METVEMALKEIKNLILENLDENISDYNLDDLIESVLDDLYNAGWESGLKAGLEQQR